MRLKFLITLASFAGFVLIICGCGLLYGYKPLKQFDSNEYNSVISSVLDENFKINHLISDSVQFDAYRRSVPDSNWQQTLSGQPIQVLYFKGDSLVSYHANCLARGGLLNLNWNVNHRFEIFPPTSAISVTHTMLSLPDIRKIYNLTDNNEYLIIVFWSTMLSKVSKKTIETVKTNLIRYGNLDKTSIVLINTDKYYIPLQKN